jgi:CheY-like chemotaxis protein
VVEDSEDHVMLLRLAFQRAGITNPVQVATKGDDAIDYLSATGSYSDAHSFPLPTVVFLDLKMPGTDGFAVLRWIRQQPALKGLIVVMLTSSDLMTEINMAYELGANAFITKPIDLDRLVEMMRAFRDFFLSAVTPPSLLRPAPDKVEATEPRATQKP